MYYKCKHFNADLVTEFANIVTLSVFLSGFGARGGKTAICNLVGGHGSLNMQICQFQGGARVSLGGANAPPRPPLKETLIVKRIATHF